MTALDRASMTLHVDINFRLAKHDDIPKLEWDGQYTHFRNLFRRAYREQEHGRRLILLADYNDYPIGHIFIQLHSQNSRIADGTDRAYFYSFRVMAPFRGQGVGTRIINESQALMLDRGFSAITIAVAKENINALRLYERLGYQKFAEDAGHWSYTDHRGRIRHVEEPCWLLEKILIT